MFRIAACIFALSFSLPVAAATYTVTSTVDSGPGTLRQAIVDANGHIGDDTIAFAIPGAGVHTIQPLSNLPLIADPLVIDGYTQPGSQPNTQRPQEGGLNAVLNIELSGTNAADSVVGLIVGSTDATLRGLVINGFRFQIDVGSFTNRSGEVDIEGCYLGTDPSGTVAGINQSAGIQGNFHGGGRVTVGGASAPARNLISGFIRDGGGVGITLAATSTGPVIEGNLIGTDVTGTQAIATQTAGILIRSAGAGDLGLGTRIGGDTVDARNVISGNGSGISISCSATTADHTCIDGLQIGANYIGSDITGTVPLPNIGDGITFNAPYVTMSHMLIGGETPAGENLIAWNGGHGIFLNNGNGLGTVEIARNRIFGNAALDLDLPYPGRNANDPGDADESYTNRGQNYPEIIAVDQTGDQLTITYTVDTAVANATYPLTVRFYRALGGGADLWLGEDAYSVADAQQQKQVVLTMPASIAVSGVVATAADAVGNTSEFSDPFLFGDPDLIFANGFDP